MPNDEARTPVTAQELRRIGDQLRWLVPIDELDRRRAVLRQLADQLERNAEALKEVAAWCYQYAGATGAPAWALDNLSALASGKPAPHAWAYPAVPHDRLERNAEVQQKLDDALERIVQLEDEYKYTRAAIREGLSEAENISYPVTREKVILIRMQRDELKGKLAGCKSLRELTLQNELRWMRKHEDLLNLIASLRDWKSPDGVLQVKDLKWFEALHKPPEEKC